MVDFSVATFEYRRRTLLWSELRPVMEWLLNPTESSASKKTAERPDFLAVIPEDDPKLGDSPHPPKGSQKRHWTKRTVAFFGYPMFKHNAHCATKTFWQNLPLATCSSSFLRPAWPVGAGWWFVTNWRSVWASYPTYRAERHGIMSLDRTGMERMHLPSSKLT